MQVQTIQLAHGQITGEFQQPKGAKQLIIFCHGYQSSRTHPTIIAMANMLSRKGYATFTFNFRPNKGSIDIEHQVSDILRVLDHYKGYSDITLLGCSFAALGTTIATLHSPRVTRLVTISGFFGRGELGHEHRRNYLIFRAMAIVNPKYRAILHYLRRELQPGRIHVPVLVIHSSADQHVFIRQSQRFYAQLTGTKQFEILKTANHGVTDDKDRKQCAAAIDTWLQTT